MAKKDQDDSGEAAYAGRGEGPGSELNDEDFGKSDSHQPTEFKLSGANSVCSAVQVPAAEQTNGGECTAVERTSCPELGQELRQTDTQSHPRTQVEVSVVSLPFSFLL
jgi:hypothetical protein